MGYLDWTVPLARDSGRNKELWEVDHLSSVFRTRQAGAFSQESQNQLNIWPTWVDLTDNP